MSVPPLAFAGRGCQAAGRADGWLSGRLPAGWPPIYYLCISMEKSSFEGIAQSAAILLHGWRFLRQDQLVALLDLKQDDQAILDELDTADILRRFTNPLSVSPTESIYALGKRGVALAASAMGVDRAHLRRSSQTTAVKPLFLEVLYRIVWKGSR